MKKYNFTFVFVMLVMTISITTFVSCSDDTFSTSRSDILTFSEDTIRFDTLFANVNSSTVDFWVYNDNNKGIKVSQIRLMGGNQTGYRINVDGTPLSSKNGYTVTDFDIRKGDSIRIFAEVLPPTNPTNEFTKIEDRLVFLLESGVEQSVPLTATSINAEVIRNLEVKGEKTLGSGQPLLIYGRIKIDTLGTLTINSGSALCFHDGAGIDVYGKLIVAGTEDAPVVMRGDRLDRLFSYLPYDNISGQWEGIHFFSSSYNNIIKNTDIHGAKNAIVCDSADLSKKTLDMENVIVHNSKGKGVSLTNSVVELTNCQLTNALENCLYVCGGSVGVYDCTIAQFYKISEYGGTALVFTNQKDSISYPLHNFIMFNSIVTGQGEDEVLGQSGNKKGMFVYNIHDCLLKTVKNDSLKKEYIHDIIYESNDSAVNSAMNFRKINDDSLYYDFHLDSLSKAIESGNKLYATEKDIEGNIRKAKPSMGCYEYFPPQRSKSILRRRGR